MRGSLAGRARGTGATLRATLSQHRVGFGWGRPMPGQVVGGHRPLSQVGSRRKRCPGKFGQDGMGSIPATPSTKHASCFPPSSMPASIEISIKLIVCLSGWALVQG